MEARSPILNYTKLDPEGVRRTQVQKIYSIVFIVLGCLAFAAAVHVEIRNFLAGSELPFEPLPSDASYTWRTLPWSEGMWRRMHLDRAVDPTWETRPLTPVERAEYERFRAKKNADAALHDAVFFSCWAYPVVAFLLFGIPWLMWKLPPGRWRLALGVVLMLQLLVICSFYRLGYGDALLRALN